MFADESYLFTTCLQPAKTKKKHRVARYFFGGKKIELPRISLFVFEAVIKTGKKITEYIRIPQVILCNVLCIQLVQSEQRPSLHKTCSPLRLFVFVLRKATLLLTG